MISYGMTDKAILSLLGDRLKTLRLRKNITLEELHLRTGISINTLKSLEKGHGKLATLIAVLRSYSELEHIDQFIPPIQISPIQLFKLQGKQRQRARKPKQVSP